MKKTLFSIGILTMGLMATDFASMTTDELIALRGTVAVEDRADYSTEMLSRIDSMSIEELVALRASNSATSMQFTDIDTDNDGKISEDELDIARADRQAEAEADGRLLQNIDNEISFSDIDTNDDGYIDATEFQALQSSQMATRGGMGQGQGMGQSRNR